MQINTPGGTGNSNLGVAKHAGGRPITAPILGDDGPGRCLTGGVYTNCHVQVRIKGVAYRRDGLNFDLGQH